MSVNVRFGMFCKKAFWDLLWIKSNDQRFSCYLCSLPLIHGNAILFSPSIDKYGKTWKVNRACFMRKNEPHWF